MWVGMRHIIRGAHLALGLFLISAPALAQQTYPGLPINSGSPANQGSQSNQGGQGYQSSQSSQTFQYPQTYQSSQTAQSGQSALTPGSPIIPDERETLATFTGDALYDSNIVRSSREFAAIRGLKLADEIFTPDVQFILARPVGRQILFLEGDANYYYHAVNSGLNREHIDVTAGVNAHVGPCQEVPTFEYSRQQTDLANQSLNVVANAVTTETAGATISCGRQIGLAPMGSISQVWRTNDAPQLAQVNSNTFTAVGGMGYRQPVFGVITLFGSYAEADFPNRPNPTGPPGQTFGYLVYAGGVTYDRHLGGRIEGVVTVSFTKLDPNSSISPSFQGITYAVDVNYHLSPEITLHAASGRATQPSNRLDANFSVNQTYEVDVSYLLGSRLTFTLTGFSTAVDYHTNIGAPLVDLTQETTNSILATVMYALNPKLSIGLNGGQEDRWANFPGLSYSSSRIGMTIKATY